MKKFFTLAISAIIVLVIAMSGCQADVPKKNDIDIHKLAEDMTAVTKMPDMLNARTGDSGAESAFAAISDLEYDKIEEFTLYYAADGAAYELAVVKLESEDDMKHLAKSLNEHIKNRVKQYKYYNPEEVPRAENAVVATNGRYAALIMCDDTPQVKAVFDGAF